MCGIAGLWGHEGSEAELTELALAVADRLAHRGPDDRGAWCDPAAAITLGHRRLAVIDPTPGGHQPMVSRDGRWVLTFNGEIYNYRELAADIVAAGGECEGRSDTEVLVEMLALDGPRATLPRLDGMFAIAAWDRRQRELWLVRDRLGIKPLYYGLDHGALLFASELKAFRGARAASRGLPAFSPELDRDALALYLRYGRYPAPHSVYRGFRALRPGHLVHLTKPELAESEAWWDAFEIDRQAQAHPFTGDSDAAVDELEARLEAAVRARMIADVPLGAFLSGGIDSSLVVALMQKQSTEPIKTFSIGFEDPAFDEAGFAAEIARRLGTEHTQLYVTPADALALVPELPALWDEPFADSSQIPTLLVSRLAREHVTVCLSGDGGDELFGGYPTYSLALRWWRRISRLPRALRSVVAGAIAATPSPLWSAATTLLHRALPNQTGLRKHLTELSRLDDVVRARSAHDVFRWLSSHWRDPSAMVIGSREVAAAATDDRWAPNGSTDEEADPRRDLMLLDTTTYLPDDILTKVDRASMAASLEARVPLLDPSVFELARSLPTELLFRGGDGKWILRQVLARHLPPELWERPKRGFAVPLSTWLRGPLRDWAEALLDESRLRREGLLEPRLIRAAWRDHLLGRREMHHRLWNVLMFQAWFEAQR